jgi:enoyl-CoA hydratase/carnithine racemase
MDQLSPIKYEVVHDGVAVISYNRPEQLNAISHEMTVQLFQAQLFQALDPADGDPDVRVVILTREDRSFCAGTAWTIHLRSVSGPTSSIRARAFAAAQIDGYSFSRSSAIRTVMNLSGVFLGHERILSKKAAR